MYKILGSFQHMWIVKQRKEYLNWQQAYWSLFAFSILIVHHRLLQLGNMQNVENKENVLVNIKYTVFCVQT